jgi:hypothetical protein
MLSLAFYAENNRMKHRKKEKEKVFVLLYSFFVLLSFVFNKKKVSMGCEASSNNIVTTPTRVVSPVTTANRKMSNLDTLQTTTGIRLDLIVIFHIHLVSVLFI